MAARSARGSAAKRRTWSSAQTRFDSTGTSVATRLPKATLTDLITGESTTQPIVGCDAISYPDRFSGLGLLSVLTFDLSQGLLPTDVEAVMTDGTTVYASAASTYVATETVIEPPQPSVMERLGVDVAPVPPALPSETTIHRFDTSADDETIYASSGRVEGRILNEWSLSEHEGNLRVATTTGDSWIEGAGESESGITVLAEDDGELETVGEVWGLGPGEEIFGVRFVEEMGYVVTFEQTVSTPMMGRTSGTQTPIGSPTRSGAKPKPSSMSMHVSRVPPGCA